MTALARSIDPNCRLKFVYWKINWNRGIGKNMFFIMHPYFWVCINECEWKGKWCIVQSVVCGRPDPPADHQWLLWPPAQSHQSYFVYRNQSENRWEWLGNCWEYPTHVLQPGAFLAGFFFCLLKVAWNSKSNAFQCFLHLTNTILGGNRIYIYIYRRALKKLVWHNSVYFWGMSQSSTICEKGSHK